MRDITFAWPPGQLTVDHRLAYNGISKTYARQVFESLVDIDPATAQLRPWLGSTWSRPDRLTVVLTIAPGRRFSDGAPLTADLVRNSFCDIMTDLAGVTPLPSAVAALTGLSGVEARGGHRRLPVRPAQRGIPPQPGRCEPGGEQAGGGW